MQGVGLFVRGVATCLLSNQLSGIFLGESAKANGLLEEIMDPERSGCLLKIVLTVHRNVPNGAPIDEYLRSRL
jgi:hypothetical protein